MSKLNITKMDLIKVDPKATMKASKTVIKEVRRMAIMKVIVMAQVEGKVLVTQEAIAQLK